RIGTEQVAASVGPDFDMSRLSAASEMLHADPLVAAVMTALWRDAEVNGLSSAFFDHGVGVLINRLTQVRQTTSAPRAAGPLNGKRLRAALDLLEARIASDLPISDLAAVSQMDVRSFTRAFRAATGVPPYAYLTLRRMERAKDLLLTNASIIDVAL